MANEPDDPQTRYVAQQLNGIAEERARILQQMDEMQAHLEMLNKHKALLSDLLPRTQKTPEEGESAASTAAAPSPDGSSDTQAAAPESVPRPRRRTKRAGSANQGKDKAKSARSSTGRSSAQAPSAASKAGARPKKTGPTRVERALDVLRHRGEWLMVSDVTQELSPTEPDVSPQVVRNALNHLVAAGKAVREKRERNVFYAAVAKETDSPAEPETGAAEAGEEKAAAGV